MITVPFSKAQEIFELLNESCDDEPICVICDYTCPYSSYEDGQGCERETTGFECWSSFLDWLKQEREVEEE
jgi:hypothetical protein